MREKWAGEDKLEGKNDGTTLDGWNGLKRILESVKSEKAHHEGINYNLAIEKQPLYSFEFNISR